MDSFMITFSSVTPAQSGEATLRKAGFTCSLQRTPRWMEAKGCGYSVRLRAERVEDAIRILQERKVRFRKVYKREKDGTVTEVTV